MPTAKTGNKKRTNRGLRKVIPRLLIQRVVLEVVNGRHGANSSQKMIRTKTDKKNAVRMTTSFSMANFVRMVILARVQIWRSRY